MDPAESPLIVRRTIRAPIERVFAAWITPELLRKWWGPKQVTCIAAEVDLRVGGRYRLGNQFPDGSVVWIAGEFEVVDPPRELVYTWRMGDAETSERVIVRFAAQDGATEVTIVHERIASAASRDAHEAGWQGCLDGLAELF